MANTMIQPQAILFDYFNTVVRRVRFEGKLGLEALLKLAELPSSITIDDVMARAATLEARLGEVWESSDVWSTAQQYQRLLFDGLGVKFQATPEELEKCHFVAAMGFERTEGVHRCLANLRSRGLRLAVVSNHVCTGETLRCTG